MRTKELEKHNGSLEGIVRLAETFGSPNTGVNTRFVLESAKDKENYGCFMDASPWLQNGQYAEVNFSGKYALQYVQLDERVRTLGRNRFSSPSGYPLDIAAKHPLPIKPIYIQVFELRVYQKKGGELLHVYEAPVRLC